MQRLSDRCESAWKPKQPPKSKATNVCGTDGFGMKLKLGHLEFDMNLSIKRGNINRRVILGAMSALQQFKQLERLRRSLPDITGLRKDIPEIDIRIGLATGDAVVGSLGSE